MDNSIHSSIHMTNTLVMDKVSGPGRAGTATLAAEDNIFLVCNSVMAHINLHIW
jgi:hypothetical protein